MGLDQYINYTDDDGNEIEKYYRKVNWLRNWVIENSELTHQSDCEPADISRNKIEDLLEDCKHVLKHKEKAEDILPILEGFFFGTYEYDEWYFETIKVVKNDLEDILSNKTLETVTYSDWW